MNLSENRKPLSTLFCSNSYFGKQLSPLEFGSFHHILAVTNIASVVIVGEQSQSPLLLKCARSAS
ncbi:hypothetical protein N474_21150 [Pseudoalteromonas luteoviolacea CPMOR-2]|nr:hypothetical protein N474_21150 [Pseudoalteromonas luteoviolacea CPMOR-2]